MSREFDLFVASSSRQDAVPKVFGIMFYASVEDDIDRIISIVYRLFQIWRRFEIRAVDICIDNRLYLTNSVPIPVLILTQICVFRDVVKVLNTYIVQRLPIVRTEKGPALNQYVLGLEWFND